ncbi:MAG: 4-alpha-glucanotransferase [Lachnospiraceae bacterium]|nr:4-alpha-glucanotransferase [Lachnospiraceae bacterium]
MKKLKNEWKRAAGILMPVFSLPSPYGCGTLGKAAYDFVDFVKSMGSSYWQVLPVGPTSYGDSPYQGFSAFAGNPYFIDLDLLCEEGLLDKEELEEINWGTEPEYVDYGKLYENRYTVLRKAFKKSDYKETEEYAVFEKAGKYWLDDYALFMACKNYFGGRCWQEWEFSIRLRKPAAVKKYKELLAEEVDFQKFLQFEFFKQWNELKEYANEKGVEIIGDIPLYVSMDSADCWAHKDLFELDEDVKPINIAGVPPDAFSDEGQRWGNPLYRWDVMEKSNFKWWRERMKANAGLYDVIRIDHFIGIVNYWSIPAKAKTAKKGKWIKGPGEKLTNVIDASIGNAKIIAEDLGVLTQPVKDLINKCGYPGMKIIEFACGGDSTNEYLPHNYASPNCIVYAGTHDNETLQGYLESIPRWQFDWMKGYFGILKDEELHAQVIRKMYESTANVVIVQMQDLLGLDNKARINEPATCGSNWQWRMLPGAEKKVDIGYYSWMSGMFRRNNG